MLESDTVAASSGRATPLVDESAQDLSELYRRVEGCLDVGEFEELLTQFGKHSSAVRKRLAMSWVDSRGSTLLQRCVEATSSTVTLRLNQQQANTALILELLRHRADPNAPNARGQSALHLAAMVGNTELCKLLIVKYHALLNVQDSRGKRPEDYAVHHRHHHLAEWLASHRAAAQVSTDAQIRAAAVAPASTPASPVVEEPQAQTGTSWERRPRVTSTLALRFQQDQERRMRETQEQKFQLEHNRKKIDELTREREVLRQALLESDGRRAIALREWVEWCDTLSTHTRVVIQLAANEAYGSLLQSSNDTAHTLAAVTMERDTLQETVARAATLVGERDEASTILLEHLASERQLFTAAVVERDAIRLEHEASKLRCVHLQTRCEELSQQIARSGFGPLFALEEQLRQQCEILALQELVALLSHASSSMLRTSGGEVSAARTELVGVIVAEQHLRTENALLLVSSETAVADSRRLRAEVERLDEALATCGAALATSRDNLLLAEKQNAELIAAAKEKELSDALSARSQPSPASGTSVVSPQELLMLNQRLAAETARCRELELQLLDKKDSTAAPSTSRLDAPLAVRTSSAGDDEMQGKNSTIVKLHALVATKDAEIALLEERIARLSVDNAAVASSKAPADGVSAALDPHRLFDQQLVYMTREYEQSLSRLQRELAAQAERCAALEVQLAATAASPRVPTPPPLANTGDSRQEADDGYEELRALVVELRAEMRTLRANRDVSLADAREARADAQAAERRCTELKAEVQRLVRWADASALQLGELERYRGDNDILRAEMHSLRQELTDKEHFSTLIEAEYGRVQHQLAALLCERDGAKRLYSALAARAAVIDLAHTEGLWRSTLELLQVQEAMQLQSTICTTIVSVCIGALQPATMSQCPSKRPASARLASAPLDVVPAQCPRRDEPVAASNAARPVELVRSLKSQAAIPLDPVLRVQEAELGIYADDGDDVPLRCASKGTAAGVPALSGENRGNVPSNTRFLGVLGDLCVNPSMLTFPHFRTEEGFLVADTANTGISVRDYYQRQCDVHGVKPLESVLHQLVDDNTTATGPTNAGTSRADGCYPEVHSISVANSRQLCRGSARAIVDLLRVCPNLRRLDFSTTSVADATLAYLVAVVQDTIRYPKNPYEVDETWRQLAQEKLSLKELCLDATLVCNLGSLVRLAEMLPTLTSVSLQRCKLLRDSSKSNLEVALHKNSSRAAQSGALSATSSFLRVGSGASSSGIPHKNPSPPDGIGLCGNSLDGGVSATTFHLRHGRRPQSAQVGVSRSAKFTNIW